MKKTTTSYFAFILIAVIECMQLAGFAQAWTNVGSASFTPGTVDLTHLAFNGSTPYIAYMDKANMNKISVMKYNGTSWVQVGNAGFSQGRVDYLGLAFDGTTPYVAFSDSAYGGKASVMKFNGTKWVHVGNTSISVSSTYDVCLAFSGSTPYVAFMDGKHQQKATVLSFNGASWDTVGVPGFTKGAINFASFAIDGSTPYLAYADLTNGDSLWVMKYTGGAWSVVGNVVAKFGISTSIAINRSVPYVAYSDGNQKLSVMALNGNTWTNIGAGQFALGAVYNSLAFNDTIPYVAFGGTQQASVMKFNGTNWVQVGKKGFSVGNAYYTSLAFSGSIPYVGFRDATNNKATVMDFVCSMKAIINSHGNSACNVANGAPSGFVKVAQALGNGAYNYSWSNGSVTSNTNAVTNTISGLSAGTYSVTVTDINTCTATASYTITEPVAITENTTSQVNVSCNGLSDAAISIIGSGGTGLLTYNWSTGSTVTSLTNVSAGVYTLTVTDASACSSVTTISITEPPVLQLVSIQTPLTLCPGESQVLIGNAYGGTSMYTYNWQPSGPSIAPLSPTTYTVYVQDANGCSTAAQTVTVNVKPMPDLTTTLNGATITANETGAIYSWFNCATHQEIAGETGESFVASANGSYAVLVSKAGCADTSTCVNVVSTGIQAVGNSEMNVVVYPNPNHGVFTIGSKVDGIYSVVDELGRVVRSIQLNTANNYTVNVENLNAGIYFIVGMSKDQIFRKRIVVTM